MTSPTAKGKKIHIYNKYNRELISIQNLERSFTNKNIFTLIEKWLKNITRPFAKQSLKN